MTTHQATGRQITASDPAASVWVTASAGTGKTRVLTDRVLRLMLSGTAPERILCLTFTRAAAAEMANRVHGDLSRWAIQDDSGLGQSLKGLTGTTPTAAELERARQLFARVLDAPGSLKIQTIHAFCESLLSRFPLESGVPPHFSVIDERTSMELLHEARDEVLRRAGTDAGLADAVGHLTAQVSEERFGDAVRELTSDRARLERLFHHHGGSLEGISTVLYRALDLTSGEDEATILEAACRIPDTRAENLRQIAEAMGQGSKTDRKHGELIRAWAANPEDRVAMFPEYLSAFFTGEGSQRARLIHKEALEHASDDAEAFLREEAERLEAVKSGLRAVQTAADTLALLGMGRALMQSYEGAKQGQALLDYDDLISRSRRMLARPDIAPWVLYKLDGGLDHVLIDEAQDTNDEQWRVIAALTDEFFAGSGAREAPRTVFAVGDAKQSIYSFQRADPLLFAEWRDHFGMQAAGARKDWRPVELVHSYRSVPPVLSLVDEVFRAPDARAGLVFDDVQIDHIPNRVGQAGVVELWPAMTPDEGEDVEAWEPPVRQVREATPGVRLARRIARQIARWLEQGERLPSRDREVRPGDIMILVQRRAGFVDEMVRALKQGGIPVAGTDRMTLTEQLPVMDLLSLGRFAVLPEDDLALAEVLKSPLFGFDDDALFDVAWDRGHRTLWASLRQRQDRSPAYAAAVGELEALLAAADHMPPYELFAIILGPRAGRRKLVSRLGAEANDPLDEFLALCLQFERLHAPTLQGFLHWVVTGETEVKRDLELGRNEVRVLTVHGAKGLQAPIVFLPDTCRTTRDTNGIHWLDAGDNAPPLPLWPARRDRESDVAQRVREAARQRQEEESRRLLYVALTRAEDRLYIGGFEGVRGRPPGCWYDLVAQAMTEIGEPASDLDGQEILSLRNEQTQPADRPAPQVVQAVMEGRLPDWAARSAPPEPAPPAPLVPSRPDGEEPPIRSPLGPDEGARFRRGRLIHRLLELLPEIPQEKRTATAMTFLANPAYELRADDQQDIADVTLGVLENPAFAAIFGPGSRAEVAVVGTEGGHVVSGQIDRLLVTDDAVLVVDYKSDRPAPQSAENIAEVYLRQLALYSGLLQKIYPAHSIRCALLWTDGPRLMEVDAGILAPYLP